MKSFWWWKKADGYVPVFSDMNLALTKKYVFTDVFGHDDRFDLSTWMAAREVLWAIREGLVDR